MNNCPIFLIYNSPFFWGEVTSKLKSNVIVKRVYGIIKHEFCIEKYKVDLVTQQKIVSESIDI